MSDVVIRVEGLGKRYSVGAAPRYRTIRESVVSAAAAPARWLSGRRAAPGESQPWVWALQDVSFEVRAGEVIGVIGRNGAGKSTLLKILSRITGPTRGYVELAGRVGSLLEVGTGFHPELSGRENIFLNGAILGMTRAEIGRKFDEIVAFSEVERFLDTPVKRYSSGMYTRLAFAVAAHLEPEVLVVDEVLAVGDAGFQKKCMGKMGQVAQEGRTVLFVSHNISAINSLCSRAILLDGGRLDRDGEVTQVTAEYNRRHLALTAAGVDLRTVRRRGTGAARFVAVAAHALDPDGSAAEVPYAGCDVRIEVELEAIDNVPPSNVAVIVYDANGYRLLDVNTALRGEYVTLRAGQRARVRFHVRDALLREGTYVLGLWVGRHGVEEIDSIDSAYALTFADPADARTGVKFPSPYACRFESSIEYNPLVAATASPAVATAP